MKLIVSRLVHLLPEGKCGRELIGWVNLTVDSIYSFAYLQICDENLPSFAVSTLVCLFLREHSPNAERFTFPPLFHVWTQKTSI